MKIYTKTCLVLLLSAFLVTAAFAQQEGKTPPKKEGKPPVVKVEDKNDREQKEREKQEEQKRRENKKPQ